MRPGTRRACQACGVPDVDRRALGRADIVDLDDDQRRVARAWWSTHMTASDRDGQAPGATDAPGADRGETAEADRSGPGSPAQQAVINEEKAFESGEENPS